MSGKNGAIKLVAGNSNPALAQGIANYLKLPLAKAVVRRFADMSAEGRKSTTRPRRSCAIRRICV